MTSLHYTLVMRAGPDDGCTHRRGLAFSTALNRRGHQIRRVFFYGAGVRIALPWDPDTQQQWRALTESGNHGCELTLCSASAERYGVETPPKGFIIAGLGSLMEAGVDSDRVLTFG